MKRSFGQFKKQWTGSLPSDQRALCKAFDQGAAAGREDKPRGACPYMPETEEAKFQAWHCGYNETAARYVVRK